MFIITMYLYYFMFTSYLFLACVYPGYVHLCDELCAVYEQIHHFISLFSFFSSR